MKERSLFYMETAVAPVTEARIDKNQQHCRNLQSELLSCVNNFLLMRVNMQLPNSVQEVADVIGREAALFLIGKWPKYIKKGNGSTVYLYVPTLARLGMDHDLVKVLGWPDAEKLSRAFGGEILQLASCTCVYRSYRDQQIIRLVLDGLPKHLLAEWFDVSDKQISKIMRDFKDGNVVRMFAEGVPVSTLCEWFKLPAWQVNKLIQQEMPHEEFSTESQQNPVTNNRGKGPQMKQFQECMAVTP